MASAAWPSSAPSWRAQRGHRSWRCAAMDCRASLAVTKNASWRAQRGHPSWRCAEMDCRAPLAGTKGCHGERSPAIHLGGARRWTAALRSQRRKGVMASAARPSIVEVRGDGLPRFARSDKKCVMASAARPSIVAVRGHPSWRCAEMDCRASLAETTGCHGERRDESGVMASAARPSILEVRGDGLPRSARRDGKFRSQGRKVLLAGTRRTVL